MTELHSTGSYCTNLSSNLYLPLQQLPSLEQNPTPNPLMQSNLYRLPVYSKKKKGAGNPRSECSSTLLWKLEWGEPLCGSDQGLSITSIVVPNSSAGVSSSLQSHRYPTSWTLTMNGNPCFPCVSLKQTAMFWVSNTSQGMMSCSRSTAYWLTFPWYPGPFGKAYPFRPS